MCFSKREERCETEELNYYKSFSKESNDDTRVIRKWEEIGKQT